MSDEHTGLKIRKSLAKNVSVLFGAQVITWASSFILLYFLPRYLGSEDFGRLYLALSIKMMLGLLIDFGGNYLIPKEVARSIKVGSHVFSSYIIMRIVLWVLSIGLIILLSNLLGYSEHVHLLILILAIGKLWEGGYSAISAYFQGIEQMEYPSIGNIVERVFVSLVAVGALLLGANSIDVAIIMTVGAFLNLLVLIWFSRNTLDVSFSFDFEILRLVKTGMPYFLFSLFSVIYYRVDAVMISSMTNETITGWYGGAFRFFDIVMVLPLLYKTAIFPIFSKLWDNQEGVLETTVSESVRLMIILGFPVAFLIYFYAEPIIHFFIGLEEYGPSVVILQIFALSIPFIYIDIILGSALLGAANKQKSWAIVGLIAIFVNIGVNFLLIPYTQTTYGNGGIGAAAATLITEIFVMGSAFVLLPTSYLHSFKSSFVFKPAVATLLMLALLLFLKSTGIYWMLSMGLSGLVYIGCLFLVKTFTQKEIDMMAKYISMKNLKLIVNWRGQS